MAKVGKIRLYHEGVVIDSNTPQDIIKRHLKKYPILELHLDGTKKRSKSKSAKEDCKDCP